MYHNLFYVMEVWLGQQYLRKQKRKGNNNCLWFRTERDLCSIFVWKMEKLKKSGRITVDNDKQRAFNQTQQYNKTIELMELKKHVKRNCVGIEMNDVDEKWTLNTLSC